MPSAGHYKGNKAKARKEAVGFDSVPPLCMNCTHYQPCTWAQPECGMPYKPRLCRRYGFDTHAHAVCDGWQGKNGDRLNDDET